MLRHHSIPLCVIACITIALTLSGCAKQTESIDFAFSEITLKIGESTQAQVNILPTDATNKDYSMVSSDDNVAKIENGYIHALNVGTAIVTVQQGDKDFGQCTITVEPILLESIIFRDPVSNVKIGRSEELSVQLTPEETTDKAIIYTSSNSDIAAVSGSSLVGVSEGSAVITATHASGLTAEYTVTISPVLPESMQIIGETGIEIGSSESLGVSFNPTDVTDKTIEWDSENSAIASVDGGILTAKSIGETTISAKHKSGAVAYLEVEVKPVLAKSVSVSGTSNVLYPKESVTLSAKIYPENTTDKSIQWISNDTKIATVSDGYVKGIAPGNTTIKAITSNQIIGTYQITVMPSTKTMTVMVSSNCSNYNHVGNEWSTYYSINGTSILSGNKILVTRNGNLSVYSEIVENDSIPDVGSASSSVVVKTEYFEDGFIITQTINVRENRGRYSGNVATWTITYTFTN